MKANITILGQKETVQKLWLYHAKFNESAKRIMRTASKMVETAYKRRAPVGKTGNLRDSVKAKNIYTFTSGPAATVMSRATRAGFGSGWHRHIVAYGTQPRTQRKTGRYTGVMPKNNYADGVEDAGSAYFNSAIRAEVEKHVVI